MMKQTVTISVIIPVYNIAPYIARCFDSVLAQTDVELEIIAVNDGSSDDSGKVLDVYAETDSRVRVIHKENGGVTSARLCGIEAAGGEWIGFVDGDDEIEPGMYKRLLDNALKHKADISHCGHQMVYPDGHVEYYHNTGRLVCQDSQEGIKELLDGSIEPGLCNKLFRKELFQTILRDDPVPKNIRINEDLLMCFYLFRDAQRLVYEDICPYYYLKREGSASMATLNPHRIHDPLTVKERILEMCAGTPLENTARAALLNTYINVYNSLIGAGDPQFDKDLLQVRQVIAERLCDAGLLVARRRIFAYMIAKIPTVYRLIYSVFG